ncbi:MAG: O-antigen ligase family protein, partial [Oscillospiraceae bacterium]|nr:O-antigen ligase family protein [Oscillospiraceae bacterium]
MIYSFLNLLAGAAKNMQERHKAVVRKILYLLVFGCGLFYSCSTLYVHILYKCIIGSVLLGLIIIFTVNRPITPVKWDPVIVTLWVSLGLVQLLSGLLISLEYLPMCLIWTIGFPLVYLVWSIRRDYWNLLAEVAWAGNVCVVLLLAASVVLSPITLAQYPGITINPNNFGMWLSIGTFTALFLFDSRKKPYQKWLYRVELCAIICLCVACSSRTAVLSIAAMCAVYIVGRIMRGISFKYFTKQIALTCACLVLTAGVICGVNAAASLVRGESPFFTGEGIINHFGERVLGNDKQDHSIDNYSSGRLPIWREVLRKLNLLGRSSRDHIITGRNGDVGNNAHNIVLQYAYDNGVIAGALYALILLYTGAKLAVLAWKRRKLRSLEYYALIMYAGFFCTGMLANNDLPFLYLNT